MAIKIRDEKTDRYEEKLEQFTFLVNYPKIEKEEYIEYEKLYKTEEEILARAEELRISAGHTLFKDLEK